MSINTEVFVPRRFLHAVGFPAFALSVVCFLGAFSSAVAQIAMPLTELSKAIGATPSVKVEIVGERLFATGGSDLWLADQNGHDVRRVEGVNGKIETLVANGRRLYVRTQASPNIWIVNEDGVVERTVDSPPAFVFSVINGHLYLADLLKTDGSLWAVSADGKSVERFPIDKSESFNVDVVGDQWVVLTHDGLLYLVSGEPLSAQVVHEQIRDFQVLGDRIFARASKSLLILGLDGQQIGEVKVDLGRMEALDNAVLVFGKRDLSVIGFDGTVINRFDELIDQTMLFNISVSKRNICMVDPNHYLWIFGKDRTAPEKVDNLRLSERSGIECMDYGDYLLVGTSEDKTLLLRADRTQFARLEVEARFVRSGRTIGPYAYIGEDGRGIFRIDPTSRITSTLQPNGWWANLLGRVLPASWLPAEKVGAAAFYADSTGQRVYDDQLTTGFSYAMAEGDTSPSDDKFSTAEQFSLKLSIGRNDVRYWVKDKWGNRFEQRRVYYGAPTQYLALVMPFVLSVFLILGCFALAPKVGVCHSVVMNPWLRKYFSLGSIPILLSMFPMLRRHILRRYAKALGADREFSEWKTRFVCPDESLLLENFGQRIATERRFCSPVNRESGKPRS